jgi:hypothetical protein
MDYLIAKVKMKGSKKEHFHKLVSDKTVYAINIANIQLVDYEPDHNLDEDSWFQVENFLQQSYCIDLLKKDFVSAEYNEIPKDKFSQIAYLCAVQSGDYFFQKVTPSLYATRKAISFGENVKLEEDGNRLYINNEPDAIYLKDDDKLIFRSLATVSSIFKGIDGLYKEATKQEVSEFLDESFIELTNDYGVDKVSKPNRKRVALAMTSLAAMSAQDQDQMLSYIHSYCDQRLTFDQPNKKFEIQNDEELKYLLYGIEQRFYTTILGQEKRLANSVQTLT